MAQPVAAIDLRVVEDLPGAFAELVRIEQDARFASGPAARFRLGLSGGGSGRACQLGLAGDPAINWARLSCFLADERCVEETSPDANIALLRETLADHLAELDIHPMRCRDGPQAYEEQLRAAGGLDVLQLGFGPDGHTASLFPGSPGLDAPPDRWVIANVDPRGNNAYERLSLTFAGIASAALSIVTVTGADKRAAFAALLAGEDLPAARIASPRVIWLCQPAVVEGLTLPPQPTAR